jgi:acyl-CoA thioester hydrolase
VPAPSGCPHLGLEQDRLAEEAGVVFVVRRVEADYLRPARFNDRLACDCDLAGLNRASLTMIQRVRRGDEVLLEGMVKVACVDRSAFRPARIPEFVMRAFETESDGYRPDPGYVVHSPSSPRPAGW